MPFIDIVIIYIGLKNHIAFILSYAPLPFPSPRTPPLPSIIITNLVTNHKFESSYPLTPHSTCCGHQPHCGLCLWISGARIRQSPVSLWPSSISSNNNNNNSNNNNMEKSCKCECEAATDDDDTMVQEPPLVISTSVFEVSVKELFILSLFFILLLYAVISFLTQWNKLQRN